MQKFVVGDLVTWESQAGGFTRPKTGAVIEVVKPGELPKKHTMLETVVPRSEVSYVIQIGKRLRTYWPRARHLRREAGPVTETA